MRPKLALSWDGSGDGLTYVFHLKGGARFHDGSTVRRLGREVFPGSHTRARFDQSAAIPAAGDSQRGSRRSADPEIDAQPPLRRTAAVSCVRIRRNGVAGIGGRQWRASRRNRSVSFLALAARRFHHPGAKPGLSRIVRAVGPGYLQIHQRSDRGFRCIDGRRCRWLFELPCAGEFCAIRGGSPFYGIHRNHRNGDGLGAQ